MADLVLSTLPMLSSVEVNPTNHILKQSQLTNLKTLDNPYPGLKFSRSSNFQDFCLEPHSVNTVIPGKSFVQISTTTQTTYGCKDPQ